MNSHDEEMYVFSQPAAFLNLANTSYQPKMVLWIITVLGMWVAFRYYFEKLMINWSQTH